MTAEDAILKHVRALKGMVDAMPEGEPRDRVYARYKEALALYRRLRGGDQDSA